MTTINPQIDAAVLLMKARAAEFDQNRTMDQLPIEDGDCVVDLLRRATNNLESAWAHWEERYADEDTWIEPLIDTMNLCALTLSVLPRGGS